MELHHLDGRGPGELALAMKDHGVQRIYSSVLEVRAHAASN